MGVPLLSPKYPARRQSRVTGGMNSITPCTDQYNLDAVAEYKKSFEKATVLSREQDTVWDTILLPQCLQTRS